MNKIDRIFAQFDEIKDEVKKFTDEHPEWVATVTEDMNRHPFLVMEFQLGAVARRISQEKADEVAMLIAKVAEKHDLHSAMRRPNYPTGRKGVVDVVKLTYLLCKKEGVPWIGKLYGD